MALHRGDADGCFALRAIDAGALGFEPPQLWTPDEGKAPHCGGPTSWLSSGCSTRGGGQCKVKPSWPAAK